MRYYFESKTSSQIGSRDKNEDRFYSSQDVLAISDGMGGHIAGEIASGTLIEFIDKHRKNFTSIEDKLILKELPRCVYMANKKIADKISQDNTLKGMGATLTLLSIVNKTHIYTLHVGDSRCYKIHKLSSVKTAKENGQEVKFQVQQLTRDHTFAQSMIDYGLIDEPLNEYDPRNSLLTHVLNGNNDILQFDMFKVDANKGDYFLLTTDGFHNILSEDRYLEYVMKYDEDSDNLDKILQGLLDQLKSKKLQDNSTCILAQLRTKED